MATEPNTGLTFQEAGSLTTDALHNQVVDLLAVWLNCVVLAVGQAAPTGSEAEGDRYIVGTGTGVFAGHDAEMAILRGSTWQFHAPPADGVPIVKNLDDGADWECDDTGAWAAKPSGGDVAGPASSTDNTLPRFDGTGGKDLQGSGVVVSDSNEISGYKGNINFQTGTSYTLQSSDTGKIIEMTNGSAITLTLPNSLDVGFCCTIVQGGAGQVTTSAASGATRRNRQSHTKLAGQWAEATLYVRSNSGGASAEYVFAGDTTT